MKVTIKGARCVALGVFVLLTMGGFMGTIYSLGALVETNQLIFALLAPLCAYLTIIFFQCMIKFIDEVES